jgi:hypothetical protein
VDSLVKYPYVVGRVSCEHCTRRGAYRLARLAAKYGAEISLQELLVRLTADCEWARDRHPLRQNCMARFSDLEPPRRPPDHPGMVLKVVRGGKKG